VDVVNDRTCNVTPIDTDLAPIKEVRLNAVIEGDAGIVITPKTGSVVLVCMINEIDAFVSMCSEIEKIDIVIGGKLCLKNNGYSIKQAFDELLTAIKMLTVTTGTGPSGIPINIADFEKVQQNIDKLLA
jgi:hypothetical protein